MKKFLQFEIPFAGLKEGKHQFEYDIDNSFFDSFEAAFVKAGDLKGKLDLFKQSNVCTLDFFFNGNVSVECDRCLEPLEIPVETEEQLLLKFSENPREEEEIIYLLPGTEKFNVAQYIYEFISLSLPFKRVHPENEDGEPGCDPDVLKYLDEDIDDDDNDNSLWDELQKFKE